MVLTDTGVKLSKSLIREGKVPPPPGAAPWMLDATAREGDVDSLVDAMVWLVGRMMSDPKHFYRSYTTVELDRLMTARPATAPAVRAREMSLFRRYFDLVASGEKTIEVRVQYPSLRNLAGGDHIRFVCGRDDCLTEVKRVTVYPSFEAMIDAEGPEKVNPTSPGTSSSPTSAGSTAPRRKPSASWRSRSSEPRPDQTADEALATEHLRGGRLAAARRRPASPNTSA